MLAIGLLFAFLFYRSVRIALRAADEYATFLALGFASLIALEMLLISGGVLGVIPLSGVVSPFLSFGNTAMLANFFIFAVIAGISSRRSESPHPHPLPLARPVRWLCAVFAGCAIVLVARAAYVECVVDRDLIARDAMVYQEDGVKRPQHNPRLNSLARELTRGVIYDRNGVVLASSRWTDLEERRDAYQKLGVSLDNLSRRRPPLLPVRFDHRPCPGRSAYRREFPRLQFVAH